MNTLVRESALAGAYVPLQVENAELTLTEVGEVTLWQIAAWPDTLASVARFAAQVAGSDQAPEPQYTIAGREALLMRVQPLLWWCAFPSKSALAALDTLEPAQGTILDISHSRTLVRVSGARAKDLLSRLVTIDLRDPVYPVGTIAATACHHIGIHVHRRGKEIYDLYLPRSFARSLWEMIAETAAQWQTAVAEPEVAR